MSHNHDAQKETNELFYFINLLRRLLMSTLEDQVSEILAAVKTPAPVTVDLSSINAQLASIEASLAAIAAQFVATPVVPAPAA